jgi:hypothetical protein
MSSSQNLTNLFSLAVQSGILSPQSSSLLTGNLGNVVVAGAAGTELENITATDVTLVTVLIDRSSSIENRQLAQAVRDGQGLLVDAFSCAKERDSIMMALWTFNDDPEVLHSYVPVVDATRLTRFNYRPGGSTCLYDTWCDALAANVAYAQRLRDGGTPCQSVVVVITDGEDVGSKRQPRDCAKLSADLLASEQFVLAFVGVGKDVDFRAVAKGMGIPDRCVLVCDKATPTALRQAFHMVSQSAIRASRGQILPGPNAGFFQP